MFRYRIALLSIALFALVLRAEETLESHGGTRFYGQRGCATAVGEASDTAFESESAALREGYHPCPGCFGGDADFFSEVLADRFAVRSAKAEEVKSIRRLYNTFRHRFPFIQTQMLLDSIQRRELSIAYARENPELVAGLIRWYRRKDGWSTVHEIAVHPSFQRHGVARALIERVPKPRWLKCVTENEPAMEFYRSLGMRIAGTDAAKSGKALTVWADESELRVPGIRGGAN